MAESRGDATRTPAVPVVVFLAGSGRSGSTLLERMLGTIPGFVNVGELLDLSRRVARHDERCGCGERFSDCDFWGAVGKRAFGSWSSEVVNQLASLQSKVARQRHLPRLLTSLSGQDFRADLTRYRELYSRIYRGVLDEGAGEYVVDASKWPAQALALYGPEVDLRVIQLVRDVRGVAYSMHKQQVARPHATVDTEVMENNSPSRAAARWTLTQTEIDLMRLRGVPVARVRYEDLVTAPGGTIATALRSLGIEPGDDVQQRLAPDQLYLGPSHGLSGNPSRFRHGRTPLRLDETWKSELPTRDRLVVTAVGSPQLFVTAPGEKAVSLGGSIKSASRPSVRRAGRGAYVALGRPTAPLRATPDFVVIGAQRCGTTSLFRALTRHPQIVRPTFNKGVNYFDMNYHRGPSWYRAHFPLVRTTIAATGDAGPPAVFEASGYYLYHPDALHRLARDLPDVKIVVMLRDPVERAYSAFEHERARGYETEDFETALELEDERLAGEVERMRREPRYASLAHRHHSYRLRGQYAEQLDVVYSLFGSAQVHIMQSEAFFSRPGEELRALTDFLGLAPIADAGVEQHNARPRAPMRESTRERLRDHFTPHDDALATMLGRPLEWHLAH